MNPILTRLARFEALLALVLALLLALTLAVAARAPLEPTWFAEQDGRTLVRLHFFHSESCPHCREAAPVLRALAAARPWLAIEWQELEDEASQQAFADLAHAFGRQPEAVPTFFACRQMVVGFDARGNTAARLAALVDRCHAELAPAALATTPPPADGPIDLPLWGTLDADQLSLPVLTLVLGGLDAFNPCAFFVLLFLLSFLAHAKSRARMALVGGLFITVSGVMYFLFMAAWLNLFLLLGHIGWITLAAGLVALVIGGFGVKDYFWFGEGPSLSIPAGAKPSLFGRMGRIAGEQRLPVLLAGTALLAITANMYELLCTSGFPMVYTSVLAKHGLSATERYLWLAAYNVVYVLPLFVIVGLFVATLGARKLSEREGRLLKLVSGLMMLQLGLVLILAPQLLSSTGTAVLLLAGAVALTALVGRYERWQQRKT